MGEIKNNYNPEKLMFNAQNASKPEGDKTLTIYEAITKAIPY
jgi:hypothetical protein